MKNPYVALIGAKYPGVQCHARGEAYDDIVWTSPPIAKAVLDADLPNLAALERAAAPRDPLAEIDAMRAALVKKGTVSEAEIEAERGRP